MNKEDKQLFVRRLIMAAKDHGLCPIISVFVKDTALQYGFMVTDKDLEYEMCGLLNEANS